MMQRIFLSIFLILSFLKAQAQDESEELQPSNPEQVASIKSPHFLIGGVLSPLSGQPILRQRTDLIAKERFI